MRALLRAIVLSAVLSLALAHVGAAAAAQCGLPDTSPLWIDYDDYTFAGWQEFARPNVIDAVAGTELPQHLRGAGAQTIFPAHTTGHRPHRALAQRPPLPTSQPLGERVASGEPIPLDRLRRSDRLGGLLHEYELAA